MDKEGPMNKDLKRELKEILLTRIELTNMLSASHVGVLESIARAVQALVALDTVKEDINEEK